MKVLIIGLGSIALKHINALKILNPEVEIYALRSGTNSSLLINGVIDYFSWDEIGISPDFIIISNPTVFHAATIEKALAFDCPLFIEKPVTCSLAEAESLKLLFKQHPVITYIACNLRFHPVIRYLREYVRSGDILINEINVYCGSYLPDWRENRDYTTTYSAIRNMGGGVHLDLIHELDYCYWLFGNPDDSYNIKRKVSSLDIDSIDSAIYLLMYPSFTINLSLNYFRKDSKRSIEILTEDETLYADLLSARVVSSGGKEVIFENYSMVNSYIEQMEYFLENLAYKQQPMNSFEESLNVIKIALK